MSDPETALDRLSRTARTKRISTNTASAAATRASAAWHSADRETIGFRSGLRDDGIHSRSAKRQPDTFSQGYPVLSTYPRSTLTHD